MGKQEKLQSKRSRRSANGGSRIEPIRSIDKKPERGARIRAPYTKSGGTGSRKWGGKTDNREGEVFEPVSRRSQRGRGILKSKGQGERLIQAASK